MKKKKDIVVWLDDFRPAPKRTYTDDPWVVCRTAEEVMPLIEQGIVAFISFDHDLGEGRKTGADLANFIEKLAFEGKLKRLIVWECHTQNPVGRENIDRAMFNAYMYALKT